MKYTVQQITEVFGVFRANLYLRAYSLGIDDIVARIDAEMDAALITV